MAKHETVINGSLSEFLPYLRSELKNSSASCSIEDESYINYDSVKIAVISFERYSMLGSNRVGMTVTMSENNGKITIIAMSVGGSSAKFFKINTIGENNFLNKLIDATTKWSMLK